MDINGNQVGQFNWIKPPSFEQDGHIDISEAIKAGRIYMADDGYNGIADGEYRFVVTTEGFEPNYGQGEGFESK